MFSILVKKLICFLLISYTMATATNDDLKDDSLDRGAHSDRQGLWFGPRLGKRSQILNNNRPTLLKLIEAADAVKFYYDQLPYDVQGDLQQDAKDMIYMPNQGRDTDTSPDKRAHDNVEFTPRLGRRRIADFLPVATTEDDVYKTDPVFFNPMSFREFSPRLGRNVQFSPRLGRQLNNDVRVYPNQMRVVRSVNNTKAN